MKHTRTGILLLAATAVFMTACETAPSSPPKTSQEITAEGRRGEIPDNVRDPRPEMPPTGPMFVPMR